MKEIQKCFDILIDKWISVLVSSAVFSGQLVHPFMCYFKYKKAILDRCLSIWNV